MKSYRYFLSILTFIFTFIFPISIMANDNMHIDDKTIEKLYQNPILKITHNIPERIAIISAYFLGKPYKNGALGEGKNAPFNQNPLYRTDAFDCLTYVSTVLALANANNLIQFQQRMLRIQYRNAQPAFFNRLHFTSVDWNFVNEQNGFIHDITRYIVPTKDIRIARAVINKPAWYQKMTAHNLVLHYPLSSEETKKRLAALHALSAKVSIEISQLPYIPLTALFNATGKPNQILFNRIPSGAIIEIVRPNWDLTTAIGTHLNISHMGFAIRTPNGLMFREASSSANQIIDIPLIDYLQTYQQSTTVKGIHVEMPI